MDVKFTHVRSMLMEDRERERVFLDEFEGLQMPHLNLTSFSDLMTGKFCTKVYFESQRQNGQY